MSDEFEAIGALTTAGLIVKSAGRHTGAEDQSHDTNCANCGAALAGAYCHVCGQRGHVHRSLLHMAEEAFHGIAHFDGKVWRTLPLLAFKPGKLTREYIDGKRATYVSPMGLFLFVVFLMFMVFSFGHHSSKKIAEDLTGLPANVSYEAKSTVMGAFRANAADAQKQLSDDVAAGRDPTIAAENVAAWEEVAGTPQKSELAKKIRAAETKSGGQFQSDTGVEWIDGMVNSFSKNPELTLYKLKNTAYKFSFLLIPISAPFIWLLFFWRRDVGMYDHAVFAIYSLSFMSLLFSLGAVLSEVSWISTLGLVSLLVFVPPIHMYKQLKYTYGLTRFGATWRTFVLLIFASIALSLFASAILAMGLSE